MSIFPTKESYRKAWDEAYTQDPPVPLNLDIELASTCNAACPFCLYGDRDWNQSMLEPDWDGGKKRRLMPKEMAFQLIDEAARLGIPAIKFNFRGESLLHKDYGDIVEYARGKIHDPEGWARFGSVAGGRAGEYKFYDLIANTNGNAPEANWDSAIRGLMACTKVAISLDSLIPETYAKVRPKLSLESACRTIDELVRRGHPDLWVRRVVCKSNKDEPFVAEARARWPNGVRVSEHAAFDRSHYAREELTGEDHLTWERTYCGYPSQRIVLEASGRYVPCCIAWSGEFDAGTWPGLSLKDYWASEWRRNLAQELRAGVFKNDKCQNCTSFLAYKRPERAFVQDVEAKA